MVSIPRTMLQVIFPLLDIADYGVVSLLWSVSSTGGFKLCVLLALDTRSPKEQILFLCTRLEPGFEFKALLEYVGQMFMCKCVGQML